MKIKLKIFTIIFLLCFSVGLFHLEHIKAESNLINQEINGVVCSALTALQDSHTQIKNEQKLAREKKLAQERFFENLERKRELNETKRQAGQKQKEYEEEQNKIREERELKENAKLIFIGDSRTVGMCNAVAGTSFWGTEYLDYIDSNGNVWIAHGGIAYAYLRDTGFPTAESHLEPYDSVIVLMGINDNTPGSSYASLTNSFAEKWKDLNISVYYVSINPVVDSSSAARQYNRTNALLSSKNMDIKNNLENVTYIDTYSQIIDSFDTYDGIHYTDSVSSQIYNIIVDSVFNHI